MAERKARSGTGSRTSTRGRPPADRDEQEMPEAEPEDLEEDEFLERRGIKFAIRAEFQRNFGHSVRLARSVDPELIGFAFGDAHRAVEDRRHHKCKRGKN